MFPRPDFPPAGCPPELRCGREPNDRDSPPFEFDRPPNPPPRLSSFRELSFLSPNERFAPNLLGLDDVECDRGFRGSKLIEAFSCIYLRRLAHIVVLVKGMFILIHRRSRGIWAKKNS
jgi:hypothetical protein